LTKRLCFLFLIGSGLFLAASNPDDTYGDMKNGRFWNTLPSDARPFFLFGMLEGWQLRQLREQYIEAKVAKAFWMSGGGFTMGDLANMVTSVYNEPENLDLPIGWVAMGCYAVKRGDTTRDLVFMALRKHLSDSLSKKAHPAFEDDPIDVIEKSRSR
jgi:hypothetical protein